MKGIRSQASDSPRTPIAGTSWKSCTRFVLKIKSELGLFTFLPINLEVGIENEKRVKSVPQASLGGQSVKCSGRTNEPPEKFTFYFAHAKATPRNAKARHGRAHLLKLPKLPPPIHPPHPPRPLVLLNTPTFCLKPRQAGTWNPSALNREISGDILKQCNFPFCSLLLHIFTFNPLLFDIPFFIRAEEIELWQRIAR